MKALALLLFFSNSVEDHAMEFNNGSVVIVISGKSVLITEGAWTGSGYVGQGGNISVVWMLDGSVRCVGNYRFGQTGNIQGSYCYPSSGDRQDITHEYKRRQ